MWESVKETYLPTISKESLQTIAQQSIGETLSKKMVKEVGQCVREKFSNIVQEAVTCAKWSRSSIVEKKHISYALEEHQVVVNPLLNWLPDKPQQAQQKHMNDIPDSETLQDPADILATKLEFILELSNVEEGNEEIELWGKEKNKRKKSLLPDMPSLDEEPLKLPESGDQTNLANTFCEPKMSAADKESQKRQNRQLRKASIHSYQIAQSILHEMADRLETYYKQTQPMQDQSQKRKREQCADIPLNFGDPRKMTETNDIENLRKKFKESEHSKLPEPRDLENSTNTYVNSEPEFCFFPKYSAKQPENGDLDNNKTSEPVKCEETSKLENLRDLKSLTEKYKQFKPRAIIKAKHFFTLRRKFRIGFELLCSVGNSLEDTSNDTEHNLLKTIALKNLEKLILKYEADNEKKAAELLSTRDPRDLSQMFSEPDELHFMSVMGYRLRKEQHQFFIYITESCTGLCDLKRQKALQVLSKDPAVYHILPELCMFIADAVNLNVVLKDVALLAYLLQMVEILHSNAHLKLQPFLHRLIPAVVTCHVADELSDSDDQCHWQLREYACKMMGQLVNKFANSTNRILLRLMNMYKSGLEKSSLTTIYGSLIGLQTLGHTAIYGCVIPKIRDISTLIEPHLTNDGMKKNPAGLDNQKQAALYIQVRIVNMCTPFLYRIHKPPLTLEEHCERHGFVGPALHDAIAWQRICDEAIKTETRQSIDAKIVNMMGCLKLDKEA